MGRSLRIRYNRTNNDDNQSDDNNDDGGAAATGPNLADAAGPNLAEQQDVANDHLGKHWGVITVNIH